MAGKRFIENIGTKDEGTVVVASRASVATDAKNRRLPPERKSPVLLVGGRAPKPLFAEFHSAAAHRSGAFLSRPRRIFLENGEAGLPAWSQTGS